MRLWPFRRKDEYDALADALRSRAIDIADVGRFEDRPELLSTPEARRAWRRDIDLVAIYGAVYAAIRKRVAAIVKPKMVLVRERGDKVIEEPDDHPALQALYTINEGLTYKQGIGLIEQHKLSEGSSFWLKRRNGLGVPVEFEIWPPDKVDVVPDKKKPWVPAAFKRYRDDGTVERVDMRDVIWFRHLVDPRNPLKSLSPIGAIRFELDTGMEARRFNQTYFDNALSIGRLFTAEDVGKAESARLEKELEVKFRGTDKAGRAAVLDGNLKPIDQRTPPHKDMEFLAQLNWGVEETCRVFEIPEELMGAGARTYENAPTALKAFWQVMADQFEAMMEEFTEFYIWPDFGREFRLIGHYDHIPALQIDREHQAKVDDIYLKNGKVYINELRERDGEDTVAWGDTPVMPNTMVPLGSAPTPPPRGGYFRGVEDDMERDWARRLRQERDALIAHLKAADRAIDVGDVDSYDWDWLDKHGKAVKKELIIAFQKALDGAGFLEGAGPTAQQLAEGFANTRVVDILAPNGKESISAETNRWVRGLVRQSIKEGESMQTLAKNLREGFGYSPARAERIARTEAAVANGKGSLTSYQSLGHEGKEWSTAGATACPICLQAEGDGPIPLGDTFSNGFETVPGHPNCRCSLMPVREMPRNHEERVLMMAASQGNRATSSLVETLKGNGQRP